MNPEDILGKTFSCECGKTHSIPVHEVLYAPDAASRLPEILARYAGGTSVAVIADDRTYAVQGHTVEQSLRSAGHRVAAIRVPDPPSGEPVCDEQTKDRLMAAIPTDAAYVVAVGSGVINDLCKWVATERGTGYLVVATAASMNGYTSANIAPSIKGLKRLIPGTAPHAVVAEPSVIEHAPDRLTTAGLGDVIAKTVSMTDWKINHLLFDEYYCPLCERLIQDLEPLYRANPRRIREKDPATIGALFSALVYSGLTMTLAGTSFPASGGEHLISHVLDMTAPFAGVPHDYHGRQVGIGTLFAAALYARLAELEAPVFRLLHEETDRAYWQTLTPIIEEEHALKRPRTEEAVRRLTEPGTWDRVRETIVAASVDPGAVKACLRLADAAHCLDHIGCSRERFTGAVRRCHQMRNRFTVIDLARAADILPEAIDAIVDEYLVS